jgi:hypothetical protein
MKNEGKANSIFRPDPEDWRYNACVGANGGPYDKVALAKGYYDAAELLCDAAICGDILTDIVIYPIVYNYRHAVGLYLKALLEVTASLTNQPTSKFTHSLNILWISVFSSIANIEDVELSEMSRQFPKVTVRINQLHDFDPNGETFRFPEDKKGVQHLAGVKYISIRVLKDELKLLCDFLRGCESLLQDIRQFRLEELD